MEERWQRPFRVGEFRVYPLAGRIVHASADPCGEAPGEETGHHVGPKEIDVLVCLARDAGEVVARETIIQEVWGHKAITYGPLTRAIHLLREAFGDDAKNPRYLRVSHGRGYALIAAVRHEAPVTPPGSLLQRLVRSRIVRVIVVYFIGAGVALQLADVIFEAMEFPALAMQIVIAVILVCAPVAIALGLAPPSDRSPQDPGAESSQIPGRPPIERQALVTGIAVTVLALLLAIPIYRSIVQPVTSQQGDGTAPPLLPNTIAVIPFHDAVEDDRSVFISEGFPESLQSHLSELRGILVKAWTSSYRFKEGSSTAEEIGRALGVRYLLNGSVRAHDHQIILRIFFVDCTNGFQLWARSFESTSYEQLLAAFPGLADEIVRRVASKLDLDAGDDIRFARRHGDNPAALEEYLKGLHQLNRRTPESIRAAIAHFEQARRLHPDYALANAGIASAYNLLTAYGALSGPEAATMMEAYVADALRLDPRLPEVQTALGAMLENRGDIHGAEQAYEEAIALNENYAVAHMWLGLLLHAQHQIKAADLEYRKALELDPLNAAISLNIARVQLAQGRLDEGMQALHRVRQDFPEVLIVYPQLEYWSRIYGRPADALRWARVALDKDGGAPQSLVAMASASLAVEDIDAARTWIARANRSAAGNSWVSWSTAELYFLTEDLKSLADYTRGKIAELQSDARTLNSDLRAAFAWRAVAELLLGDEQSALDLLRRVHDEAYPLRFEPHWEIFFLGTGAIAAERLGFATEANAFLTRADAVIAETREAGWNTPPLTAQAAALHALRGERSDALRVLRDAVSAGFRNHRLLRGDPSWDGIRDSSQFTAIVAEISGPHPGGATPPAGEQRESDEPAAVSL